MLYVLAETLRQTAILLSPFMPQTARSMLEQLGCGPEKEPVFWEEELVWGRLAPGTPLARGTALFPRIEVKKETASPPPRKVPTTEIKAPSLMSIEEFKKWDLRVARVLSAERIPQTDKLIKMKINLGEERTLVAGIGRDYAPEDLVGKSIVVVANLKPTQLMGGGVPGHAPGGRRREKLNGRGPGRNGPAGSQSEIIQPISLRLDS